MVPADAGIGAQAGDSRPLTLRAWRMLFLYEEQDRVFPVMKDRDLLRSAPAACYMPPGNRTACFIAFVTRRSNRICAVKSIAAERHVQRAAARTVDGQGRPVAAAPLQRLFGLSWRLLTLGIEPADLKRPRAQSESTQIKRL